VRSVERARHPAAAPKSPPHRGVARPRSAPARSSRPSNNPGRVRREAIATQGAENSRIKSGKSVEQLIDFVLETEAGNVVDELEQDAIAERPYTGGVALPAQSAGLRCALGL
jgi:hypothetical protein